MKIVSVVVAVTAAFVLAATAGGSTSISNIGVKLDEMSVGLAPKTVAAGKVTFVARNVGTVEHELVVLKGTPLLPIRKFKAQEPEGAVIDEVEDIAPSKTARLTVTLTKGRYLLFCNLPGHYQLGMRNILIIR